MNPLSIFPRSAVRLLAVLVAAGTLIFAAGCGFGGGGNGGGGGGGGNQGFSKASLNGRYVFTMRGVGLLPGSLTQADYFVEGGVFTADGNGNLTAGTDDFVQGGIPASDPITGAYSISSDGSGELRLDFSTGSTRFRITLVDNAHFYLAEDDGFRTSYGSGEKQDQALLSTIPSGTFVVRAHDSGAVSFVPAATMAKLAISGGAITGSYYLLESGSPSSGSVTGAVGTPTDGRGTLNYTLNGTTHGFFYYVVSSGKFRLLEQSPNSVSLGQAEAQSAITFSNSSLSGSYAFGSNGETTFIDGINTVGAFTTDGGGNVTDGNFDSVQDGVVSSNMPVTSGTYTINSDGFGTYFLGSAQNAIWMVSPSRAYFIALNGINTEDGTLDKQTGTFSNSSWSKQAAFFMDGFDGTSVLFKDRVGTLTPDGSGALKTNYVSSFFDPNLIVAGSQSNNFSGNYAVSGNGRTTAQLNGFTNNLVLYLVSNNNGYFLQADPSINIGGAFTQQTGP
ncbi:MAG: hypothetical protein HY233_06425 [Acidobacteriales bacterium]|nr:hypothetical protein [Terriglobales bacterium]